MPYIKKHCYVVYATYKDDPDYPVGAEEEICFSESEALEKADKLRQDIRFEDVTIEEEERDIYQSRKKSKSR